MTYFRKNIWFLLVASFVTAGLCGCVERNEDEPEDGEGGLIVARLQQADDCEDLLSKIQQDAVAKVKTMAEQQRQAAKEAKEYFDGNSNGTTGAAGASAIGMPTMVQGDGVSVGAEIARSSGTNSADPIAPPSAAGASGASVGWVGESDEAQMSTIDAKAEGPVGHSDTNIQVENVDEADIVKVEDGTIYMLHGNQLFVVNAWPAEDLSLGPDLVIEGAPVEMFVQDGRAVIYSRVFDNGELGSENRDDYSGMYYDDRYYGYCGGAEFTKISLVDVSGGEPSVVRELYVEGSYQSGRLHGSMARTVVQGGFKAPGLFSPNIEFFDPWGRPYEQEQIDSQIDAWLDLVIASIRSTELSDWLPLEKQRVDGEIVDVERRCRDFYAPSPGMTDYGLTNIVTLDITEDEGPLSGASILGSVSEVYASKQTMLLAHHQWYADTSENDEGQRTALHSFELTPEKTNYTASGFVPGHILNQFSMDVDDETGVIRLATTKETWNANSRFDNRVFTLQAEGDELKILGKSKALGHENERIYSTRFIGDRGYVVTFVQRDPLIVLDLSDPQNPEVLGEAIIPGFSDYMHPLDEKHLLTIGRDTDEWGSDIGLMLQIFDVSNPTNPQLTHKHTYAPDGYSEANYNHKAFTYWADHNLLAFPYASYGTEIYDETTGSYYRSPPSSTLEVFRVSTETGFEPLGAVDHTVLMQENGCLVRETYYDSFLNEVQEAYYWACSQPEVRRGIFMDNFVYAISYAGVTVHELSDLNLPVGQFSLPQPNESSGCFGYDDVVTRTTPVVAIGGMGGTPIAFTGSAGSMIPIAVPPTAGVRGEIGAGGTAGSVGTSGAGGTAGSIGTSGVGGSGGSVDVDEPIEADAGMPDEAASS